MGLDQYAYRVKASIANPSDIEREEISYWRKHPNLHGWMEQLYLERGGKDSFNCIPLQLFERDLDNLKKAIEERELPKTAGFFFGNSFEDNKEKQYDLDFVKKAKESIENGYNVYYDSWW
jgi:hypothetical protein